jgi:hypothetical protein
MDRVGVRLLAMLALAASLAPGLAADEASIGLEAGIGYTAEGTSWAGFYDLGRVDLGFVSEFLDLGFAFHVTNDGAYYPTDSWMQDIGNQYFVLDEGFTRLHAGSLRFEGGFLEALSSIETPYEVFLNPNGHSSLGMVLGYERGRFEYESRWIGVNIRSSNAYGYGPQALETWRDKGVNYRMIAVNLGDWRVGYQESTVYIDRAFDPLYFLSPMPSILTNTILTQGGNPWEQGGGVNDNSLMGLFAEYRSGPAYAEVQLLVDDVNLNFLLPEDSPLASSMNLTKLAWSLGGRYRFDFGTLGLWHGGATAHTFAAVYPTSYDTYEPPPFDANALPYEYVYYPVSVFDGRILDLRDSSIGFPWGENALAFRVSYDTDILEQYPWGFGLAVQRRGVRAARAPDHPARRGDEAGRRFRAEVGLRHRGGVQRPRGLVRDAGDDRAQRAADPQAGPGE